MFPSMIEVSIPSYWGLLFYWFPWKSLQVLSGHRNGCTACAINVQRAPSTGVGVMGSCNLYLGCKPWPMIKVLQNFGPSPTLTYKSLWPGWKAIHFAAQNRHFRPLRGFPSTAANPSLLPFSNPLPGVLSQLLITLPSLYRCNCFFPSNSVDDRFSC